MAKRKRNPNDATMRNIRASKTQIAQLAAAVKGHRQHLIRLDEVQRSFMFHTYVVGLMATDPKFRSLMFTAATVAIGGDGMAPQAHRMVVTEKALLKAATALRVAEARKARTTRRR
jgi:hypothetical protein